MFLEVEIKAYQKTYVEGSESVGRKKDIYRHVSKHRIKWILDYRGVNQIHLAKDVGIHKDYLNKQIRTENMEINLLDTIAKKLNVAVEYLTGGINATSPKDLHVQFIGVDDEGYYVPGYEAKHTHDYRYHYDSAFTKEMHEQFNRYNHAIGLNENFLRFVKQSVPDDLFPVYSPIVVEHDLLGSNYKRQPLADAQAVNTSNEYQRTIDGKTVNLSYADYQFLLTVQDEVIDLVKYLYSQRTREMQAEVRKAQISSEVTENGITSFCDVDLNQFDPYLKYQSKESVETILNESKKKG